MTQLPQATDRFHPPKDLFHQLAFALTDGITGVARGAAVDRAVAYFLRDMRRETKVPDVPDEARDVVAFVGTDGAARGNAGLQQPQRGLTFCRPPSRR